MVDVAAIFDDVFGPSERTTGHSKKGVPGVTVCPWVVDHWKQATFRAHPQITEGTL